MAVSEFCQKVSTTLKDLRIKNNLSIEELSEKSGVSVYKIKSMENLEHDIRFMTVYRLCQIYKIKMRDFAEMLE